MNTLLCSLQRKLTNERVEALESDHELKHWSKDELREIAATYKAKLKALTR